VATLRSSMAGLRRKAEDFLKQVPEDGARRARPADLREVLHELQVHEVELRMQNEALREAQTELEDSRERYRELFEGAPLPYLVLDQSGRITAANLAAEALFGVNKTRLWNTPLAAYLDPEHAVRFENHRRATAASDIPCNCELVLLSADGAPHEVRLESVRTDPLARAWRTAIIDLTEANQLKRQVEHGERLEALGRMASGIAHDFNNLLMAMLGCMEIALRAVPPDGGELQFQLERLRKLLGRGRATVAELLDFARPSREDAQLIELDRVLQESMPALRSLLGDEIQLDLKLGASPARVKIDPSRLDRVLLNLASNARHAMPDGGKFKVESRLVLPQQLPAEVRAAIGEQFTVLVHVSDTGSGMDTVTRARAFEPFFTTKPAPEGTGLGLAMAYATIKQAGGHIVLMSRRGIGTELAIYLPEAKTGS
jgi:two-component system, cell cycle sensor histidine kinase and response regulator CckA